MSHGASLSRFCLDSTPSFQILPKISTTYLVALAHLSRPPTSKSLNSVQIKLAQFQSDFLSQIASLAIFLYNRYEPRKTAKRGCVWLETLSRNLSSSICNMQFIFDHKTHSQHRTHRSGGINGIYRSID